MSQAIPPGNKFACLSLKNVFCKYQGEPIRLPNGVAVHVRPPSSIDHHWLGALETINLQQLGTINHQQLINSNFLIIATAPSTKPEAVDNEDEALVRKALALFHAILMHGVPYHENDENHQSGLVINGANLNGHIELRSLQTLLTCYYRNEVLSLDNPYDFDEKVIRNAGEVASGLISVEAESGSFHRLKRGIDARIRGVRESNNYHRLHQFVRAIEALVKPRISKTTKDFVHRCSTFAVKNKKTQLLLKEIYVLRSATEHLNDWEAVLANTSAAEREGLAFLRSYQAELLAGHSYIRLLSDRALLKEFTNDNSIEAFWNLQDKERKKRWGKPIDLIKLADERHCPPS